MKTRFNLIIGVVTLALAVHAHTSYAQAPTGKIISINLNQNPIVITYDLVGASTEEYEVILYIMKENDQSTMVRLGRTTGDVGEGKLAGTGRRILWDRREFSDPLEGVRYQFALLMRWNEGGGIPWYVYPAAVGAGVGVWLAVRHTPQTAVVTPAATIPLPPTRP